MKTKQTLTRQARVATMRLAEAAEQQLCNSLGGEAQISWGLASTAAQHAAWATERAAWLYCDAASKSGAGIVPRRTKR